MEELNLQYFRVYYRISGEYFPTYDDFNTLTAARTFADWLENTGHKDIKLSIEEYC